MTPTEKKENFMRIAKEVADLVAEKNEAYGSSFERAGEILKILYPNGAQPEDYQALLAIIRVLDKLFRIATDKDAFGESPWRDVAGYSILSIFKAEVLDKEKE